MSLHRIGYLAIPLALLAGTAIGFAQSTTTTTTTTIEKRAPLTLSPQQRTVIYRTVTRERRVVTPPADNMAVRVGEPVPPSVVLSPLPETVYAEVPAVRPLRYFYVNNQLVLVDPATSEVAEIIDQ